MLRILKKGGKGMRHSKLFFIGIGLLLAGGLVVSFYASKAQAGITGSPHDFSSNGWSGGQICIVCHTPHNASGNTIAPLWNHETTGANFQIYQSSTLNASL